MNPTSGNVLVSGLRLPSRPGALAFGVADSGSLKGKTIFFVQGLATELKNNGKSEWSVPEKEVFLVTEGIEN